MVVAPILWTGKIADWTVPAVELEIVETTFGRLMYFPAAQVKVPVTRIWMLNWIWLAKEVEYQAW
jgi:hypothetical protein